MSFLSKLPSQQIGVRYAARQRRAEPRVRILLMENFREFEAGPDPFGRTYQVMFKWLQTAISIRHADTVDVQFLVNDGTCVLKRTIAMKDAELKAYAKKTGRLIDDAWCSRIAALHLKHMIETAEDFDKNLVTLSPAQIAEYDGTIQGWEKGEVDERRKAS
jgi:hypothetical protein